MTVSAADVAAALRHERPGLTPGRIHKLLYLAQGHHLAVYGEPLFVEPVAAWDNGPIVPTLWHAELQQQPSHAGLDNRQLGTVGWTLSRYGNLSLRDLETLTRGSEPVRRADENRRPGQSVRIENDLMAAWSRTVDVDPDMPPIDADWLKEFLATSAARINDPATPDDMDRLLARFGRPTRVAESA